jgi:hypothetical protein
MEQHAIEIPLQDSVEGTSTTSSLSKIVRRRKANFGFLSYTVSFSFAAILSLGLVAFCCWLIYLDFIHGAVFSISGWAQSIITFLLGAWITDRPKFFADKKKKE